jgi:serine/threonine-protein kinase RsbW
MSTVLIEDSGVVVVSTSPWTPVAQFAQQRGPSVHRGDVMSDPTSAAVPGESAEFVHLSWPADPRQLAPLRAEVRRWLAPLTLTDDAEDDLVLAVSEAASNSVEHAYTPPAADDTVELTFWTEPGAICVEIVDHGRWRTPAGQPTGRGRGIEIMQRLVAFVLIHHDHRGTRVLLRHPFSGAVSRRPARRVPHLVPPAP